MIEAIPSRRDEWMPPSRPDWVARVNEEGRHLDIAGIVPLDAASLIRTAIANTGLDDFGADDWRAPFERLLQSLNEEANLTLIGRIMTRSDLLMFLEGRLRLEDLYKRHPEIEEQRIEAPIWILGQGRSGTSILQKLMAMDPDCRTLNTYDALFPVKGAVPENGPDPRIMRAEHRMRMWDRVTPETATIHDFGGEEPIETIMAEALSFQTPAWLNLLGLTPGYNALIAGNPDGQLPSLRYGLRVLKAIQWQTPGGRWVLKSPDALSYIPTVLQVFPDVQFVWAHRDPVRALSSAVNMIGTLIWIRSDVKPAAGIFDFLTDPANSASNLSQPIDWIEEGALPREQLHNIHYHDLMADPVKAIGALYRDIGMDFTPAFQARIEAHFAAHPRTGRARHSYSVGEAERIAAERRYYERYQGYFGVPSEI
ncbi:MAG TPA: sulfotransferase [Sphingomonas sp.]|nr:sulfotransferase [Sphingomonas sp.]